MLNKYFYRYEFDNFEYLYRFKLRLKNGCKFKFLNNYYEYYFYPKENEQVLLCHCFSEIINKAESCIEFSNNVLQYICAAPMTDKDMGVAKDNSNKDIPFKNVNISIKKVQKLEYVSDKILKFKVERKLFEEVMELYSAALLNLVKNNIEDSILYYFKIIEKLSKKNYVKFHERNYTKQVKKRNKDVIYNFIKEYLHKNLNIDMTNNMLNTTTDEIYKKIRYEAYNSIFLKISFFCNCKNISVDLNELGNLVKTRNKLAHGDFIDEDSLGSSIKIAMFLSSEFVATYFFQKKYNEINIDTDTFD